METLKASALLHLHMTRPMCNKIKCKPTGGFPCLTKPLSCDSQEFYCSCCSLTCPVSKLAYAVSFSTPQSASPVAGIQDMLQRVAKEKDLVWEDFFAKLKKNEQWHVEVY